jgi:hypothetical protein
MLGSSGGSSYARHVPQGIKMDLIKSLYVWTFRERASEIWSDFVG